MAAAALRTRRIGAAAGRIAFGAATVDMSLSLSRARNSGRGRSPSMRSMSRSEYSDMAASHARAQLVDGAELQLFDRALGLAEARSGVADATLVDEALDDDVALIVGQFADQPEQ